MEEVQASGKAKSIGVSNYMVHHLETTLETAKVVPSINQIEFHPYVRCFDIHLLYSANSTALFRYLQHTELLAFHKKHGIATEAYGPLR